MVPKVVYSGVRDDTGVQGRLFQGIKFWLSLRVPQRSRFIGEVQANGGEVMPLENQADIKIVDHAKKEALPGTYSYTYIEKSIRNGTLEDLDDHVVGPPVGTVRSIGSTSRPAKTQRTKYTDEDDRILWNWVQEYERQGGSSDGNEIYKQLEAEPQVPTVPTKPQKGVIEKPKRTQDFSKEEFVALYDRGEEILKIGPEDVEEAWEELALELDPDRNHSASEWQDFWEKEARPKYLARKTSNAAGRSSSNKKILSSIPNMTTSFSARSRSGSESSSSDPSQENFYASLEAQEQIHETLKHETESSEEMPSSWHPVTLKRKREAVEDDYSNNKRRPEIIPLPIEIASTPDSTPAQSPVWNQSVASAETSEDAPLPTVDDLFDQMRQDEVDESCEQESTQETNGAWGRQASPILSEPDNAASTTQAIFQEPTQSVDLDVPPPEGWDDEEEQALENMASRRRTQITDTQGSNGTTQTPDLLMPEPDGGWDSDNGPSCQETPDFAPADDLDQSEINARLDAWIDGHVAVGWSADEAISALECTSLDDCLADEVLEHMKMDRGQIPPERRGVWTEGDDEDLGSTDARRIQRVEEKHGKKLVRLRWDFLAAYRK
ncbi:hypothetical protein MMC07_002437 [Pseudocyphellaria aurata]|nr:hypothetical protein [Pseudocyphellaria aurata]